MLNSLTNIQILKYYATDCLVYFLHTIKKKGFFYEKWSGKLLIF